MFKGSYQKKLLTILYSGGSSPLEIWSIQVKNGWTRRVKDEDMSTIVFEIAGTNVATAFIVTPPGPRAVLGISLPFFTMFLKNLKRYFTFEIQILDDKQMRRRFRFSNYQSTTKVRPFTCSVPLSLKTGWNQIQLNLANFTMKAYGTNYLETQRVQIHANCRIRRVYFSDRLYTDEELPKEYRVHLDPRSAKSKAPPMEKVSSIIKQPSVLEEKQLPVPTLPDPESEEALMNKTSYDEMGKKSATSISQVGKSSSGVSLVKHHPSMDNLESREHELQSEVGTRESVGQNVSRKSKSSHVDFALDETPREEKETPTEEPDTEKSKERESATGGDEVEEPVEKSSEPPEELVTEDELSPRTASEYAESEPVTDTDVE